MMFPKYTNSYLIKCFKILFKILVKVMLAFKKKCVWNIQRDLSIDDNLLYAKLSKTNKQKIRTKGTKDSPICIQ